MPTHSPESQSSDSDNHADQDLNQQVSEGQEFQNQEQLAQVDAVSAAPEGVSAFQEGLDADTNDGEDFAQPTNEVLIPINFDESDNSSESDLQEGTETERPRISAFMIFALAASVVIGYPFHALLFILAVFAAIPGESLTIVELINAGIKLLGGTGTVVATTEELQIAAGVMFLVALTVETGRFYRATPPPELPNDNHGTAPLVAFADNVYRPHRILLWLYNELRARRQVGYVPISDGSDQDYSGDLISIYDHDEENQGDDAELTLISSASARSTQPFLSLSSSEKAALMAGIAVGYPLHFAFTVFIVFGLVPGLFSDIVNTDLAFPPSVELIRASLFAAVLFFPVFLAAEAGRFMSAEPKRESGLVANFFLGNELPHEAIRGLLGHSKHVSSDDTRASAGHMVMGGIFAMTTYLVTRLPGLVFSSLIVVPGVIDFFFGVADVRPSEETNIWINYGSMFVMVVAALIEVCRVATAPARPTDSAVERTGLALAHQPTWAKTIASQFFQSSEQQSRAVEQQPRAVNRDGLSMSRSIETEPRVH